MSVRTTALVPLAALALSLAPVVAGSPPASAAVLTKAPDATQPDAAQTDAAQPVAAQADAAQPRAAGVRRTVRSSTARTPRSVPVEAYGAVGDGVTDDTAALQRALDEAPTGTAVVLSAGRTYLHSDVLVVRRDRTRLSGRGTLLATNEQRSSLTVAADDVRLEGLTLAIVATSRRFDAWEQMRLRVDGHRGLVVRDVTVTGSAAAGVYVGGGAHDFLLDHVTVRDTRADGIHLTGGAHDGRVVAPLVERSGDDGVAVVSYRQDGPACHDLTITSPRVHGTTWGRGVSVVGGTDVTVTGVEVRASSAAGVYVASEGAPWDTLAPVRVKVLGGTVTGANTDTRVDHGAVLVVAGGREAPRDVLIDGLAVVGTRAGASRNVGVITYGAQPRGVLLSDVSVSGGPARAFGSNSEPSSYALQGWTVDGRPFAEPHPLGKG